MVPCISFLHPDYGFLNFSLLTFLHVLLRAMKSRVLFPRTVWDSQACHKRMKDYEKVLTCFPNQILQHCSAAAIGPLNHLILIPLQVQNGCAGQDFALFSHGGILLRSSSGVRLWWPTLLECHIMILVIYFPFTECLSTVGTMSIHLNGRSSALTLKGELME